MKRDLLKRVMLLLGGLYGLRPASPTVALRR
jgi:hypothetical protein